MANVKKILLNNKLLASLNSNWRDYHQELADWCLPRKAWITTFKTIGERAKFNHLYDSTAIRALKTFSAGFHANLTNPSTQWFGLTTRDRKLMENKSVGVWFNDVVSVILQMLNVSNFDTAMQEFYMDYGCFGTGTILSLEDKRTDVRFMTIPIEEVNVEEDAYGRVCAVYRNFKLKVVQAYMMWGDLAGKEVIEKYNDGKYFDDCEFLHFVGPRERRDATKLDNLNMEYESTWIAKKDEHLIHESGFKELPYHCGRFWKESNDALGYAPSMDVLADIKLVNAMKKTILRRSMKDTDPALNVPNKGYMLPLNLNPGALNYRNPELPADSLQAITAGNTGQLPITLEILKNIQEGIQQGFFVDLFRALSEVNKQMTVPEVQRRIMENMVLLGPVVGRCTHEVLDPMIIRLFNIGMQNNKFPEPPEEIQGQEYTPVYLSPLARAQRESEISNIESFIGRIMNMAQTYPAVLDKIDEDKTVDVVAQIQSINPKILRDPAQVDALRKSREAMTQLQQQLDTAHKGVAVAKTGAEADKAQREALQKEPA